MSLSVTVDDLINKTNRNREVSRQADAEYDLDDPALFINRDLSLLEFNWRVLEEAQKEIHPLLERVKFLSIYSSNMDEFFMIRVSGLMQQVAAGITTAPADGLSPAEQLSEIRKVVRRNLQVMNNTFFQLHEGLRENGVHLHHYSDLTRTQKENVDEYFKREIFPVLTPLAVDPGRPFPHISSLSLNLAVIVRDQQLDKEYFARIKVPSILPRLIPVSRARGDSKKVFRFVWLEDLIANNLNDLFPGYQIVEAHHFRITRNADLEIEANEAGDLLEVIEATVRRRRFGFVARLTVAKSTPDYIRQILIDNLNVAPEDTFEGVVPLGLSGLMSLLAIDRPDLKDKPLIPIIPERLRKFTNRDEIFAEIRNKDILLHHPYDSFVPVIDFLKAAARDPKVVAIKQTLYRAGANSPVVDALMEASENGKQVSAMVELKARFDEESNIGWAKALEREGVHVVYGFMSLKTHSKLCLVIRREDDVVRSYVHLGTGNYNASTAKIYVDLGLFTCKPEFGVDASDLFNALTGYSKKVDYNKFLVAPNGLRNRFAQLIDREIEWVRRGKPGKLVFKMNSIIDPAFIQHLYRASQAGVQIELVVRGVCGLRPGIPNLSDNIRVTSIVGRLLEHSRIYYFHNGDNPDIYVGSADLMPRNLDRRIETLFPIEDFDIKQRLMDILDLAVKDNVQTRELRADGSYVPVIPAPNQPQINIQAELINRALSR